MKCFILLFILGITSWTQAQWTQVSGPVVINVTGFESSENKLFVISSLGVHKSTDGGITWLGPYNNGLSNINATSILNTSSGLILSTGSGIYISTNAGTLWTTLDSTLTSFNSMIIAGNYIVACKGNTVYKSINNGATWVNIGLPVATSNYSAAYNGQYLFAGASSTIYRSSNFGSSWETTGSGVSRLNKLYSDGNVIYCGCLYNLFVSIDNGNTWNSRTNGLNSVNYTINDFLKKDNYIYAAVSGYFTLMLQGRGIFKSSDNGLNWVQVSEFSSNVAINKLINYSNNILAGCDNSIFLSSDNGQSWQNTIAGTKRSGNISLDAVSGKIYSYSSGGQLGIFSSVNNGDNWLCMNDFNTYSMISLNDNLLLSEPNNYYVYLSTNNGSDWVLTNYDYHSTYRVSCFAQSGQSIFAGTGVGPIGSGQPRGRVIKSTDGGMNWNNITGNLRSSVTSVCVLNQVVFAAYGKGIIKSTNDGITWDTIRVPSLPNTSFRVLNKWNGALYAGSYISGLYKSDDLGLTWISINSNLPQHSVTKVEARGQNIYVLIQDGIYRSNNGGTSWQLFEQGLPAPADSTNILDLGADNEYVYTSIIGMGIWRRLIDSTLTGLGGYNIPYGYTLYNNYPNPFNPDTKISFTLPEEEFTVIEIYDITGRLINRLLNQLMLRGKHSVSWNAVGFASGVYFYKIKAGSFTESRKMVLSK